MLGRHVIAEGDTVVYEGGTVPLSFDLAAGASHGMVTIRDAKNEVIYSKELTGLTAGRQTFNWDGTARVVGGAAKGDYTYEVSARDSSGKARVLSSGLPITYTGASVALPLNDAKGMSNLSVTVRDAAGNAVYTQALTASQSKEGVYTWKGEAYKTGNATAGDYTFQISALNAAGKRVAVEATYGYAPVESVSLADGVTVNTRGLGSVPLGKVDRVI